MNKELKEKIAAMLPAELSQVRRDGIAHNILDALADTPMEEMMLTNPEIEQKVKVTYSPTWDETELFHACLGAIRDAQLAKAAPYFAARAERQIEAIRNDQALHDAYCKGLHARKEYSDGIRKAAGELAEINRRHTAEKVEQARIEERKAIGEKLSWILQIKPSEAGSFAELLKSGVPFRGAYTTLDSESPRETKG